MHSRVMWYCSFLCCARSSVLARLLVCVYAAVHVCGSNVRTEYYIHIFLRHHGMLLSAYTVLFSRGLVRTYARACARVCVHSRVRALSCARALLLSSPARVLSRACGLMLSSSRCCEVCYSLEFLFLPPFARDRSPPGPAELDRSRSRDKARSSCCVVASFGVGHIS